MSFLTLNGWPVATLKGGSQTPVIVGDDGRSFSGALLRDRRVVKDRWRFETRALPAGEASALVGLLLGLGDRWPFDDLAFFSDKGLGPGVTVGSFRWGESADGAAGAIESQITGIFESKFGAGALAVEPATTNMLTESQRRASSTTGFTPLGGGAVGADTTYFLPTPESTPTSVKFTRVALSDSLRVDATAVSAATDYSASIYVLTLQSGVTVRVRLNDNTSTLDTQTTALTAGVWHRFELSGTTLGGATICMLFIDATVGPAAGDFYVDGLELEQQTAPTTWADGARAAPSLTYSGNFLKDARACTFAAWVRMPTAVTAANRFLVHVYSDVPGNNSQLRCYRPATGDGLYLFTFDPDGNTTSLLYPTTIWDDDWHHVAGVFGTDGRTGVTFLKLYVDGLEVDSDTGVRYPRFGADVSIYPGSHRVGALALGAGSLLDEMQILPYAAAADQIAAWAAATQPLPTFPAIRAAGDVIETPYGVLVEGTISERLYGGLVLGGNWHHTAQRVLFELDQR